MEKASCYHMPAAAHQVDEHAARRAGGRGGMRPPHRGIQRRDVVHALKAEARHLVEQEQDVKTMLKP